MYDPVGTGMTLRLIMVPSPFDVQIEEDTAARFLEQNFTEIYLYVPMISVNGCFELYRYYECCTYVCAMR